MEKRDPKKYMKSAGGGPEDTPDANMACLEQERMFGSMVLADRIAAETRELFLGGDFAGVLNTAYGILMDLFGKLTGAPIRRVEDLEVILNQLTPCLLLPNLSGRRLRLELAGVSRMVSGLSLLLRPIQTGLESPPLEPAAVIRLLAFISYLVEKFEAATPNPAAKKPQQSRTRTRQTHPDLSRRHRRP